MRRSARKEAIYLAVSILLTATLACNISTPQGPVESTPEVVTVIATATESQLVGAPTESNNAENAPDTQIAPTSSSPSDGGDAFTITAEGDIHSNVSIKNGNASFEGKIAFPGDNTSDDIYVKPVGFDSEKTSGSLIFSLTCSGRGKAKVNYKGGAVRSGSPGCGETWTIAVINGSPDSQITLHLDASGEIDWSLTVTSGE
jgi:hypothetical protein